MFNSNITCSYQLRQAFNIQRQVKYRSHRRNEVDSLTALLEMSESGVVVAPEDEVQVCEVLKTLHRAISAMERSSCGSDWDVSIKTTGCYRL